MRGIQWSSVNLHQKDQGRRALMFPLICAWTNGGVNKCATGHLKRHCAHYDVNVMIKTQRVIEPLSPGKCIKILKMLMLHILVSISCLFSMNFCWIVWPKSRVKTGSSYGYVPSGNKPLPEQMLTGINVAIWRHWFTMSRISRFMSRLFFQPNTLFSDTYFTIAKASYQLLVI